MTINYRFKVRGGTALAVATLNEIPLARELVFETDTGRAKLGNGSTHYNDLPYLLLAPNFSVGANWQSSITIVSADAPYVDRPMPVGGTIKSVSMTTQGGPGAVVVDILKGTLAGFPTFASICGASLPTIAAGDTYQDATLTGWTVDIAAGDVLRFDMVSLSAFTSVTIILEIEP